MSSSTTKTKSYDVFLSFRGEDTRTNFTSHLCQALKKRSIKTYMDYLLDRGEDVWPALEKAIEDSHVSIVVFSENYATSKWCLEELVKILQCRRDQGQVVIPVFYQTDPSHIRKQTGSFEKAFAKYERDLGESESGKQKIRDWRYALTEAANISGWDSGIHRDDAQLIRNVVNDVLQKRSLRHPIEIKGLVGTEAICKSVEVYMSRVRVLGIWGMGGIGKTTIAKVLFAKHFPHFDHVCFVANVKEYSLDRLLFELLKEEIPTSNGVGFAFDMRKLSSKKVFIVLDDVNSLDQLLEYLCGGYRYQSQDSRLIITTRNQQLLKGRVDWIYKVEKWNDPESLQLFSLEGFQESRPPKVYEDLSARAVKYAGGVPLALKVLGSYLRSKSAQFWDSTLRKLEKHPNQEIQNLLKVSYDGLDDLEKEIFLDIAFFFIGEEKDHVKSILDACGFEASSGIDVLEDKALITISYSNIIEMHDLLQKMAFGIVRQESSRDPSRRSRLRDIEEVSAVLSCDKETDAVEGMALDLSQIKDDMHLKGNTFRKMNNMRFLKFYVSSGQGSGKIICPLQPFSDKLRYFEWNGYHLESLPANFCAKLLVEIHMPHSHVKELWKGKQQLDNLEGIDLSECKQLITLPDFSKASRLKWVNLSGCESLNVLHSSVLSSDTLVTLILDRCTSLGSVKGGKHLKSLQNISVNGCSNLKQFAVLSDLIENLDLSKTGIETLDPSIGRLSNLRWLNLEGLKLKHLLTELSWLKSLKELKLSYSGLVIDKQQLHDLFDGLRSLQILHLKDCSNLFEFPDNIGALSKLQELKLDGSSVKRLPTSIKHLQELEILSLNNCSELLSLPELPPLIKEFDAHNCTSLVSVSNLKTFATKMLGKIKQISFKNSLKLDGHSLHSIMESLHLTMVSAAFHNGLVRRYGGDVHSYNYNSVEVCLPGSRAPRPFTYCTTGSSITIQLPTRSNLLGLIYYVVLSPSLGMKKQGAKIRCQCRLAGGIKATRQNKAVGELNSDHVYVGYDPFHCDNILSSDEQKVCFEFSVTTDKGDVDGSIGIKECGVHLISVSELHSVLLKLELDSDKRMDLKKELEDSGHTIAMTSKSLHPHASEDHSQVQISPPSIPPPPPLEKINIERSEEKKSNGMRNQIQNQQTDFSEQSSYDWEIVTEKSKSVMGETDHFSNEEEITESARNETQTGPGRSGRENNTESRKAVKSKESDAGLHLPVDSVDEENMSEDRSSEKYCDQLNNIEEAKNSEENQDLCRQLIVHPGIHDLTVEEPYKEKENDQMDLDKPKGQDDSDEDPLSELESILFGCQKSSPKAACSTNNVAIQEALHNLECLLEKSLDNIHGDAELQQQLQFSLECIEQASDEKVSQSVAKHAKSMRSSIEDLLKNFALTQKVVEDHTGRLQQKEILVQQVVDARKQQELLKEKMNQYKSEAKSLDKEVEDLDEKIRLLVEQKKMVQMKQTKLKEALEEWDGEKKKLRNEAKNWVAESKELMLAIQNSEASYAAAKSKQEKLNDKWEGFRTSFADKFRS